MAWKKGESGNPNGRPNDKPFADTLRLVLKETDTVSGKLKLRRITEALVDKAMAGEGWAVMAVADRLDGKPAQESTVTIDDKREPGDWTRDDLVAFLNDARKGREGTAAPAGRNGKLN